MSRPRGVMIIALIDFIVGIVVATELGIRILVSPVGSDFGISEWYALGAIFVIFGFLIVVVGYGLWEARSWAWLLGLWAGAVYVVLGIFTFNLLILPLGIVNVLFYYFARADLKRYLGKI